MMSSELLSEDDDEINQIIANFMGMNYDHEKRVIYKEGEDNAWGNVEKAYTDSLDSLVPVVEKFSREFVYFGMESFRNSWQFSGHIYKKGKRSETKYFEDEKPARALAWAVYHVIKERDD